MSAICNVKPDELSLGEVYDRVDAPIATGSAHFMRAGAELHLMHADLELRDTRQAAMRVLAARTCIQAAVVEYETSHALARELDFYSLHNQQLQARGTNLGTAQILRMARDAGLVDLDDEATQTIDGRFATGGHDAAFAHFLAQLKTFDAKLAAHDPAETDRDPVGWQHLAWRLVTEFDRIRVYGQILAIINTFEPAPKAAATVGQ